MFLREIKCILHIATLCEATLTNPSYLIYENLRWVAWNKVIIPWCFHNLLLFFLTSAHYYGKNACLFFAALQSFKEAGFLITPFFLLVLLTSLSWQQNFKFIPKIASLTLDSLNVSTRASLDFLLLHSFILMSRISGLEPTNNIRAEPFLYFQIS